MKKLNVIRMVTGILFLVSLFCTIDLGLTVLYNVEPAIHDGYTTYSILQSVLTVFGDRLWTFDTFFFAFKRAIWIAYGLFIINVGLYFFKRKGR